MNKSNLKVFVTSTILAFVVCWLMLTATSILIIGAKNSTNDQINESGVSHEYETTISKINANIDNATSPAFILATSIIMSIFFGSMCVKISGKKSKDEKND